MMTALKVSKCEDYLGMRGNNDRPKSVWFLLLDKLHRIINKTYGDKYG